MFTFRLISYVQMTILSLVGKSIEDSNANYKSKKLQFIFFSFDEQ